ncbi:si:dkey-190l8.2 isoform X2 [Conger conger]|uniref:si:dkey-190l8.2 isoform X2 n=1 Tax=Conger conger TaxID=82655 RepID=UPI002A59FC4A|nr:si:dkey-190l8.2 isoform X2 [Conger conger]
MGPLQRSVFWKLCVLYFLTAFMFFADVFTVNMMSCVQPHERVDHNFTPNCTDSIFAEENDYTLKNVTESVNSSGYGEVELLVYAQTLYMTGLLLGCPVGGAFADREDMGNSASWWSVLHCRRSRPCARPSPRTRASTWRLAVRRDSCAVGSSAAASVWLLGILGKEAQKPSETDIIQKRHGDLVHFKSPTILLRLFVTSYIGLASALTYYGICFNVGSFGVDVYLAQFFSGLSETPSLLMPFLLGCWGRRPFSMMSLFLSGSACLVSLLISRFSNVPALVMGFALMGKLCVQITTCVTILYTIELFPTVIRQKCVGAVSLWYRLGCVANAVVDFRGGIPLVAMLCYGSAPILGAGLCLLLPETSGKPLPDTVQDCEAQGRRLSAAPRWGEGGNAGPTPQKPFCVSHAAEVPCVPCIFKL